MGDKTNYKLPTKRAPRGLDALPEWMAERIRAAELKFRQARFEDLSGNHKTAELLCDEGEAIYDELETRRAGQPGQPAQVLDKSEILQHDAIQEQT